jgi:2-keto-4-pentenoate hydratase
MSEVDPRVAAGLKTQLASRNRLLLSNARHIGWKMAFGAPGMMERLQLSAPAPGYLTDRTLLDNGASVSIAGWSGPVVEFEIALLIGADVPAGTDPTRARAAIDGVAPAIELADIDGPLTPESVADIVAGNIFHRGVILGEPSFGRPGADLTGLTAAIEATPGPSGDGVVRTEVTDFEALTGEYGAVVAAAADALAGNGARLRAGDIIIGGSIVPPVMVDSATTFTYTLAGFPSLALSLA